MARKWLLSLLLPGVLFNGVFVKLGLHFEVALAIVPELAKGKVVVFESQLHMVKLFGKVELDRVSVIGADNLSGKEKMTLSFSKSGGGVLSHQVFAGVEAKVNVKEIFCVLEVKGDLLAGASSAVGESCAMALPSAGE